MKQEIYLILHNIRSLYNVGALFRTADAAGVSKTYLTGYTPSPLDSFGNFRKEISKTALGAERYVPWEKVRNANEVLKTFRRSNVQAVALEKTGAARDIGTFKPRFPFALLVGNEVRGLSGPLLKKCDAVVKIPMYGRKESLNVAVAAGVALFFLRHKWRIEVISTKECL